MVRINREQERLLRSLRGEVKELKTEWSSELGVFREVEGRLAKAKSGRTVEDVAKRFVTRFSHLFGPKGTREQYRVFRNVSRRQGGRRISIQYVIDGLVVYDGFLVAHVDENLVLKKVRSSLPRDIEVTAGRKISERRLTQILKDIYRSHPEAEDYSERFRASVRRGRRAKRPPVEIDRFPLTGTPRLVLSRTDKGFHPVWVGYAVLPVDVEFPTRRKERMLTQAQYFVDASDGRLLKAEATAQFADVSTQVSGYAVIRPNNNLVNVTARGIQRDGLNYYLKNIDKTVEIITYDANGDGSNIDTKLNNNTLAVSEDADGKWDQWTSSCTSNDRRDSQQPEIDGHRFAAQIYEFYEALGWTGFDNAGWGAACPIRVITHIGTSTGTGAAFEHYQDAATGMEHGYIKFYDGGCEGGSIKYDFYAGELGTVAHEYQHAVTYFAVTTALGDPGGLYSSVIRGAMREGLSDSFAGFIGRVWMVRAPWPEGIGVNGPPFRRIEYPRSNATINNVVYCDHYDDIGNSADKYFKSTVLSHLGFLLAQGGIHDRPVRGHQYIPVPPVRSDATARIWHHALTDKFDLIPAGDSDERMIDVGKYLLESAADLYGNRSKEYVLLRRALYAVGLHPYDTTTAPYTKQVYGGEACMFPWGALWRRSQEYLNLPGFASWGSMDLFIDNGLGPEHKANVGEENKVYARVRNIGDQDLNDVDVEFWYIKCGTNLPAAERQWKRCRDRNGVDCTLHIALLPAGGMNFDGAYTDADAVNWYIDLAEVTDEVDHFCLRAKIICTAPNHDNDYDNSVQSNIQYVTVDPDGDTDAIVAFQVRGAGKKEMPLDLKIDHTLPEGAFLRPLIETKKLLLKPEEKKTLMYKLHVPGRVLFPLRPPFDGELKGSIYGDICGSFKGGLTEVKVEKDSRINALIAGKVGEIGTIAGRFNGHIDLENGMVEGRALVAFSPYEGEPRQEKLIVGVNAKLSPTRVVNFTQRIGREVTGGVSVKLVLKKE